MMKARSLLPLVLLASALTVRAQEKAAPDAPAAAPASELGAPRLRPPAGGPTQAPSPAPNLTPAPLPAPAPASSSSKADPALDLIPAQPGQLTPAPAAPPSQATLGPEESMLSDHARPGEAQEHNRLHRKQAAPIGASKTEKVEQDLAELVRLRQAKTQALVSDPSFISEYHAANERHTDLEKREALKKYYERLYTRIAKIDPGTSKLANERKTYMLHRLTQVRLTPTEALDEEQQVKTPYAGEAFFDANF
jgi:hypothetical protein